MKAKPMQFKGPCVGCDRYSEKVRGAVEVEIEEDSYEWICLVCAKKLADRIAKAVVQCRNNIRKGLEYRSDRWQKKRVKSPRDADDSAKRPST